MPHEVTLFLLLIGVLFIFAFGYEVGKQKGRDEANEGSEKEWEEADRQAYIERYGDEQCDRNQKGDEK